MASSDKNFCTYAETGASDDKTYIFVIQVGFMIGHLEALKDKFKILDSKVGLSFINFKKRPLSKFFCFNLGVTTSMFQPC